MKKYLLLIFVILILIIIVVKDTTAIKVNSITIHSKKLLSSQEIHMLQITDVHNRNLDGKYHHLTELKPDLIVLTGDLIDRKTTDLENTKNLLAQLSTINCPIYFVSGNHEQDSLIFHQLRQVLNDYGVTELVNETINLTINDVSFNLVGISNYTTGHADIDAAFEAVDLSKPTVFLSHAPLTIDHQVELILSGHTHGGQIRVPFIGGIIAPDQGVFPKYDKGLYQLDSGASLYIDSGLGTSVWPIRFLNPAQVSMITLTGKN
ncbi:metallophosphoesterase [Amphibacillus xylanus]|uniref:Calcineurin-like phosphoesterase domain-containing protein n=1 Tax=Amphibacillus xylanus (strain ATCC 51415 / DSM 6626 / JCM 7361 / LMG 17667 / NBRC 15112 / Ep01) TaxID=698758 RepID=K0J4V9_AMPXN|nr:metallophosphoesterase [Amphibacillus xylanus]BAM47846.1 hypothetical protein AXY_17140 [Amphibacillus xylanus NBRC 15112]